MSLKLNSPGGGSITLQEPTTSSDRTLSLPDSSTTVVGTDATQTLSNKTFSGATTFGSASLAQPNGSAPLYMCRAWVNFDGTGTVAIRASGNVSSITDNGTGDYTVNFSSAMPDANYSTNGMCGTINQRYGTANIYNPSGVSPTTTAFRFTTAASNWSLSDLTNICIAVFR